ISIVALLIVGSWLFQLGLRRRRETPFAIGQIDAPREAGRDLAIQARALLDAGRIREATRVAYRAAVYRLEEDGLFRVDETRTPREYLRLVPSADRRRVALAGLTSTFERLWYGARQPSSDDGARVLSLLRELKCLPADPAI